jgi:hypothetical protein
MKSISEIEQILLDSCSVSKNGSSVLNCLNIVRQLDQANFNILFEGFLKKFFHERTLKKFLTQGYEG